MSRNEILKAIQLLPPKERIWLMEQTLKPLRGIELKEEVSMAAEDLVEVYRTDKDLTAFTDIDIESLKLNAWKK